MTMTDDMQRKHADALLKAVERQRNEALTREVQKDAIVALLQESYEGLRKMISQRDAEIEALKAEIATLNEKPTRKSKPSAEAA